MYNRNQNLQQIRSNNLQQNVPQNPFTQSYEKEFKVTLRKPPYGKTQTLQFFQDTMTKTSFKDEDIFWQSISDNVYGGKEEYTGAAGSTFKNHKSLKDNTNSDKKYKVTIGKGKDKKVYKTMTLKPTHKQFLLKKISENEFELFSVDNYYKMLPYNKFDANAIVEFESHELRNKSESVDIPKKEKAPSAKEKDDGEISDGEEEKKEIIKIRKNKLLKKIRFGGDDSGAEASDKDDHNGDEVEYMTDSSMGEDQLSDNELAMVYDTMDGNGFDDDEKEENLSDFSEDDVNEDKKKKLKKSEDKKVEHISSDISDSDSESDSSGDDSDKENSAIMKTSTKRGPPSTISQPIENNRHTTNNPIDREIFNLLSQTSNSTKSPISLAAKDIFRHLIKMKLLKNNDPSKESLMKSLSNPIIKKYSYNGTKMYKL